MIIGIVGAVSGSFAAQSMYQSRTQFVSIASAEDDENERESNDDDYRVPQTTNSASQGSSKTTTTTVTKDVIQNVTEYKPVVTMVEVTPAEYLKDSDGDFLVDAIDPSPYIKQSEYFTDIDGDGVPNAIDRHHDEDDFAFFDDVETDNNSNGLFDSYELTPEESIAIE